MISLMRFEWPSPQRICRGPVTRGQVVREAWKEWRVNASYQGGRVPPVRPTRRFVDFELGFGFGEGPPLTLTLSRLDKTNRAAVASLGADAPLRAGRSARRAALLASRLETASAAFR